MSVPNILIAGAGIGGLTLALCLNRAGIDCEILEKSPMLEPVGAGIQLSANAVHVLAALGLKPDLMQAGFEPEYGVLKHHASGKTLLRFPLKGAHVQKYGQPYLNIHRADLQHTLVKAVMATSTRLHLGMQVRDFTQDGSGLNALASEAIYNPNKTPRIVTTDENPGHIVHHFEGQGLIGADGIHSKIRDVLFGDNTPEFSRKVAWRAMVPTDAAVMAALDPAVHAWIGPGRHVVAYYVRGGAFINIVAVEDREAWASEGWNVPGDPEAMRAVFVDFDAQLQTVLDRVQSCQIWGLFDRPPRAKWGKERVTLMGDAVHPVLPFMAQGAALAIEDAWVLAHFITQTPEDIPLALDLFEEARRRRVQQIFDVSRKNGKLYHMQNPVARLGRNTAFGMAGLVPKFAASRFDHVHGMNVTRDFPVPWYSGL